jgi:hypothetical protein
MGDKVGTVFLVALFAGFLIIRFHFENFIIVGTREDGIAVTF